MLHIEEDMQGMTYSPFPEVLYTHNLSHAHACSPEMEHRIPVHDMKYMYHPASKSLNQTVHL